MSSVYDTTNYIDTSLHLKSKLNKNFSHDNYWIESLQDKINSAWEYATDIVNIEESIEKFDNDNVLLMPIQYQTIESRIMSVYTEKGVKLSDDFKKIIIKISFFLNYFFIIYRNYFITDKFKILCPFFPNRGFIYNVFS